jgi:DNA replication protein DnaC
MPTDPVSDCWCHVHPAEGIPCRVCADQSAYKERVNQQRLAAARAVAAARVASIGIGLRYVNSSFDNYVTNGRADSVRALDLCRRFAATFSDRLAAGDSLLLLGNPGTGKNHLAAAVCHEVAGAGFSVCHTRALKMVRRIRQSWGKGSGGEDEQAAIDLFVAPDLLVLDEVGVDYGSNAERVLFFEVLNDRYENLKPTILVSNLSISEMSVSLGPRIIERFREGKSRVIAFTWESFRGSGA